MRIGFCGTHSVGKTSVAVEFAEQTGHRLVTSASRRVHSLGYDINERATVVSQAATSMARLADQLSAGSNFVSDRTLLDSMAYNSYQLEHFWSDDPKAKFWYDTMDTITRHVMRQYDLLVFFPVTFPLQLDGVRSEDVEYQREIERRVEQFLVKYGLSWYTVPNGSVEKRIEWLKSKVRE